jgi:dienelactone hydrolase
MDALNHFPQMLQGYLMDRVREMEARACERKRGLRGRQAALAYQDELRGNLRRVFGPLPRRTPLRPRVTGALERRGYRIEKLLFESRPGLVVSANLYLPHGPGPFPGVVAPCGHSMVGKAEPAYQAFCQDLARVGCAALIYDPIGQGERIHYPDGAGGSRVGGCCDEHNLLGKQMGLCGEFIGTWRVWDGIRACDYLCSRPEVDANRLGLTGNSGGGTLTTWLLANDPRYVVAAPGCYITTWRRNAENELPADAEQQPPLALALGLDMDDFLAAHAPKPLLLLTQEQDFFDQRGSEEAFAHLRRLYRLLGAAENVQMVTGPGGHGYSRDLREAMVRFFGPALGLDTQGFTETPTPAEKPVDLWATPAGDVAGVGCRGVNRLIADRARELQLRRSVLEGEALAAQVRKALALPRRAGAPDFRILRALGPNPDWPRPWGSVYAVGTEPGIEAVVYSLGREPRHSRPARGERATLYVPHLSADADLAAEAFPRDLARGDGAFLSVDCRGIGESRPNACGEGTWLDAYGSDYFYASYQEMLGAPMLGRRVHDLLVTLDWLAAHGYRDVHLAGRGWGSVTAALAAVLDDRVTRVTLRDAPRSFTEWAQGPECAWPAALCLRGVLRSFDLPDLYAELKRTRSLRLQRPWDARMKPRR